MRPIMLVVTGLCLAVPLAAQHTTPDFLRHDDGPENALMAYTSRPYHPVRMGEVRASTFLTEDRVMPFGEAIGPITPGQVRSGGFPAVTEIGLAFGVRPPIGGNYRVGDTLMTVVVTPGPKGWGVVISPTGLMEVVARDAGQTETRVVAIYGPIRPGQSVLPLAYVPDPGDIDPVATPDGPAGTVIGPPTPRELLISFGQLFIDLGRGDGMAIGDFVQLRRQAGHGLHAADGSDELMATGQVINVNARSSTIRLNKILAPEIMPGTLVVRVATLP